VRGEAGSSAQGRLPGAHSVCILMGSDPCGALMGEGDENVSIAKSVVNGTMMVPVWGAIDMKSRRIRISWSERMKLDAFEGIISMGVNIKVSERVNLIVISSPSPVSQIRRNLCIQNMFDDGVNGDM